MATELFARRGYAGTSMQDIADAVGIRKPSLYKFFSSKDDLYGAVLEATLTPLAAAIDDVLAGGRSSDGADLTATSLQLLHENPHVSRLLMQELVQADRPLHPHLDSWLNLLFTKADEVFARQLHPSGDLAERRLNLLTQLNVVLGFALVVPLLPGEHTTAELIALEHSVLTKVIAALYGVTRPTAAP